MVLCYEIISCGMYAMIVCVVNGVAISSIGDVGVYKYMLMSGDRFYYISYVILG